MTLPDAIKKLDHETAVKILLKLIDEFPLVRYCLLEMFNHRFEE